MLDDYPYPELDSVVFMNRPFPSRQIEMNDGKWKSGKAGLLPWLDSKIDHQL